MQTLQKEWKEEIPNFEELSDDYEEIVIAYYKGRVNTVHLVLKS